MKLVIASDHAGFEAKEFLKKNMPEIEWIDVGPFDDNRCDYPDYATKAVKKMHELNLEGVLICGSGIGISIAANRYQGIRAALVRDVNEARLSRQHNNANVLALGGRLTSHSELPILVRAWLEASFEGGRHLDRINKMDEVGEKIKS